MVFWQINRRDLIYDMDGSLTLTGEPTYLTPLYPHLKGIPNCDDTVNFA